MQLVIKKTEELSAIEITKIFQERVKVFVVEQNCPYQEIDEFDIESKHVILKDEDRIVAYTRIIEHENKISFGRVLVSIDYRGKNFGRKIVQETIDYIHEGNNKKKIYISAQEHLKEFYKSFGFEQTSAMYLEDGIPHIEMILNIES
ncbi:GNAT family N-acetyltransferase [Staphylococcus durrellii]|uniref:GNAT family N-acetyltransferase n=1 Tax=Staphylococcus durrellii TaxID=2781773 RepID=UPI00189F182A|nr:GNAT family N-acetyltransferase [Staphylococcus durrellii]MBF7017363.1 GNAT family N-acetyltransferase [Staphylococcus durrellii]